MPTRYFLEMMGKQRRARSIKPSRFKTKETCTCSFHTPLVYHVLYYSPHLRHGEQMSICMSLLSAPIIIFNWMWTQPYTPSHENTDLFWPQWGTGNILNAMVYIESHTVLTTDGWIYDLFVFFPTLQVSVPFERQNCSVTLFTHARLNIIL